MAIAALLAITLDPADAPAVYPHGRTSTSAPRWLARSSMQFWWARSIREEKHPISKPLMKLYHPVVEFALDHKWLTIAVRPAHDGA